MWSHPQVQMWSQWLSLVLQMQLTLTHLGGRRQRRIEDAKRRRSRQSRRHLGLRSIAHADS